MFLLKFLFIAQNFNQRPLKCSHFSYCDAAFVFLRYVCVCLCVYTCNFVKITSKRNLYLGYSDTPRIYHVVSRYLILDMVLEEKKKKLLLRLIKYMGYSWCLKDG